MIEEQLDVFVRFAEAFTAAVRDAAQRMVDRITNAFRAWGLIPPEASEMRHGETWVDPIDGRTLRVRGRRGRPDTYHWGPTGPQRWRVHG